MCEIFPEVNNCCMVINLRIGMLFISVLAIASGALMLTIVEQRNNANFESMKNVTDIRDPKEALRRMSNLIQNGVTVMSFVFMATGAILLFATLTDQEGFIQIFVWVTFVNIIFGYFLAVAVAYECIMKDTCLLGDLDWLSGSIVLVMIVTYITCWLYFIVVANSYVLKLFP